MQEVKCGDVWRDAGGATIDVAHVEHDKAVIWWRSVNQLIARVVTIEDDSDWFYLLLERDGKPYVAPREFKLSTHYPAKLKNGVFGVLFYNNVKEFKMIGTRELYSEDDFSWIGEELEIKWDA